MSNAHQTYTLTQLHTSIENWVRKTFSIKEVWITCEIAKCSEKNGHYYLELVDSNDGIRSAQAKGMIWRTSYSKIERQLESFGLKTSDVLKPGLEIKCSVVVTFHKIFGLSLVINEIDPSILLGDIERQKIDTRKRLQKEGLIDLQQALYFGPINKKIALIGSPGTSGFEDFMNEIEHNSIYTNFKLKVFPVGVQSQDAIKDIAAAIEGAASYDVDVIAIVRGGGSKMDLHIFNHYTLCKAVSKCQIPIITGIGHETDTSLVDEVAYTSTKTPTAAAKMFYMNIGVFSAQLSDASKNIQLKTRTLLSQSSGELQFFAGILFERVDQILKINDTILQRQIKVLQFDFNAYLMVAKDSISEKLFNLQININSMMQNEFAELKAYEGLLLNNTERILNDLAPVELNKQLDLLKLRVWHVLHSSREYLVFNIQKLGLVDPNQLFDKGYTISTVDGEDVNKRKKVLKGKELITFTNEHTIISRIKEINKRT
ncbi:MAG: exodeoxyribonuclease VII large subunit [Crocinitomicaceae bacterium]|nr:exodeoxyribonuclease VII large subunit [Crocinitomicaceae bacterium]MDG1735606.1 exodeoxyribonuclease VII large subunit [Crocinitomicaceae bacterium]MDG2504664.1 exodeoxyribonuclease VII large subunit [Crocinitomicaceae bacterium]